MHKSWPHPFPSPSITSSGPFLVVLAIHWVSRAQKARGAPALERVLGYHAWYFPENTTNLTETVNTTRQPLELTLGAEAYRVSVAAYNSLGQGPAAALRIPAAAEEGESHVTSGRGAAVQGARGRGGCLSVRVTARRDREVLVGGAASADQ